MRTATFQNTVDILVKAYLDNTLAHGSCFACAVGNIVASCTGRKVLQGEAVRGLFTWSGFEGSDYYPAFYGDGNKIGGWGAVFTTSKCTREQRLNSKNYHGQAKEQIDSTGYSIKELAMIEFAFETASEGESEDEWMFNGLMAVVDVLADIHGISLEAKEKSKLLFVKL